MQAITFTTPGDPEVLHLATLLDLYQQQNKLLFVSTRQHSTVPILCNGVGYTPLLLVNPTFLVLNWPVKLKVSAQQ